MVAAGACGCARLRHTLRNPHDEPVTVIDRHRPARDYEVCLRDMAALTSAGKLGSGGPRTPGEAIHAATLFHDHPDAMRLRRAERAAFTLLAAVGRVFGPR